MKDINGKMLMIGDFVVISDVVYRGSNLNIGKIVDMNSDTKYVKILTTKGKNQHFFVRPNRILFLR